MRWPDAGTAQEELPWRSTLTAPAAATRFDELRELVRGTFALRIRADATTSSQCWHR